MVTWFHTSTHRGSVLGVPDGGSGPVQAKISESGPHGPVGPLDHQLSAAPRSSTGSPSSDHVDTASVSGAVWSSPAKAVAYSSSRRSPKWSQSSSRPQRRLCDPP